MPARKNESVASHPLWVARVMSQVARPQGECHRGGSHRKTGMTRVCLLDSIRREETERVDRTSLRACIATERSVEGVVYHFITCLLRCLILPFDEGGIIFRQGTGDRNDEHSTRHKNR